MTTQKQDTHAYSLARRIDDFNLFFERGEGYHSGACTKDLPAKEPVRTRGPRTLIGTIKIDTRTGEIVED